MISPKRNAGAPLCCCPSSSARPADFQVRFRNLKPNPRVSSSTFMEPLVPGLRVRRGAAQRCSRHRCARQRADACPRRLGEAAGEAGIVPQAVWIRHDGHGRQHPETPTSIECGVASSTFNWFAQNAAITASFSGAPQPSRVIARRDTAPASSSGSRTRRSPAFNPPLVSSTRGIHHIGSPSLRQFFPDERPDFRQSFRGAHKTCWSQPAAAGISSITDPSSSPYNVRPSVRGMGVAVITSKWG